MKLKRESIRTAALIWALLTSTESPQIVTEITRIQAPIRAVQNLETVDIGHRKT